MNLGSFFKISGEDGAKFYLLRYFSVTSLLAFVVVTVVLANFYRQTAIDNLIELRENNNVALTQVFSNTLWAEFKPLVDSASGRSGDELRADPEIERLNQRVEQQIAGLSIIKIKVYNLEGLTVYSSEAVQIGDDKSDNAGFLSARGGVVASELTHRDTFSAFEGVIEDRDVVASYVPIRVGGNIEGVFEVYDDTTPFLQRIEQTQNRVVMVIVGVLTLLYLVLFFIVRRANNIMDKQNTTLLEQKVELQSKHEIEKALAEAKRANQVKTAFLASMSHELRTPLNSVINFTKFVVNGVMGPVNTEQTEALSEVIDSGTHLLALINDVLDMSKIESGTLNLFVEDDVAIPPLLETAIATGKSLIGDKPVQITADIATDLPPIRADRQRILQVLLNVVSNAAKFTQKGQITVRVARQEDLLQLSVQDTGPGIAAADHALVFEPFQQTETGIRQRGGTGLGMPITKSLVEAHQGKIWLDSAEGQGATFYVQLPIQAAALVPMKKHIKEPA